MLPIHGRQRRTAHPLPVHALLVLAALTVSAGAQAQSDTAARHDTVMHGVAPGAGHVSVPMLAGGAVMAAMGGQIIHSPTAWPRTAGGFARRVGDQAGFVLVEESLRAGTERLTGWTPDTRSCVTNWIRLVPCAARRVYGARTADGRGRFNLPLVAGIVGGTFASLAWRPEGRGSAAKARNFVATRLAISVGVPVLIRTLTEARHRHAIGPR